MDAPLKQRIVGAVVLVALAIIFVPMLFEENGPELIDQTGIMAAPDEEFRSRVVALEPDTVEHARMAATEPAPELPVSEDPADANPLEAPLIEAAGEVAEPAPTAQTPVAAAPPAAVTAAPAAPPARSGANAWVVQLGVFASRENAQALRERAQKAGFNAFVEPVTNPQRTVYRVRIGPEVLRSNAQTIAQRVKQTMGVDALVRAYP
ncbi:MAG: SPOR domain-containing protein [Gammaproteobacteria bacterium]|nr:SPOR domain-containing protein [Gammaproteobacteria bacterium]